VRRLAADRAPVRRLWDNRRNNPPPTAMENPRLLDEINERVRAVLAQSPAADLEKNLRAMLTGLFSRLDLVTREEFDVQREVLARTRQKIAQLEAKVAELESRLQARDTGSDS
jgi:BMFP domain-containing protein YqiC